jgi:hypothetical protein
VTALANSVAQRVHLEAAQAFDQAVQHVDRGLRVVERPVIGLHRGPEEVREGAQFPVRHLVAGQGTPGHRRRVEHPWVRPGVAVPGTGRLQEADVVGRVVRHQHRATQELQEGGQHRLDRRRRPQHRLGDARQDGDERWQRLTRVDERRELAEMLAGADLHRADLGDPAAVRSAAGGLQVEHHERGVRQGPRRRIHRAVGGQQRVQSALHVGRLRHGRQR